MALQARIQPHFLFNSLNSVLALIRVDPPRAETMLEDLCDLYRSLLVDARQLVPLSQELELAQTYLKIEGIRFGPRLRVNWVCQDVPEQLLVPPLLLQPLLENAVRHGVEPQDQGALITVEVNGKGGQLDIRVSNPMAPVPESSHVDARGNHMALDNLRERLELHYDAEASLSTDCRDGNFEVRVRLPIR
ncbi:MAG TPA: sensor histidine kinase [Macromonas sp.]|nr:sensor histidine kinase [Macromonas sp.]